MAAPPTRLSQGVLTVLQRVLLLPSKSRKSLRVAACRLWRSGMPEAVVGVGVAEGSGEVAMRALCRRWREVEAAGVVVSVEGSAAGMLRRRLGMPWLWPWWWWS
jgi:hypothetical protein